MPAGRSIFRHVGGVICGDAAATFFAVVGLPVACALRDPMFMPCARGLAWTTASICPLIVGGISPQHTSYETGIVDIGP